MVKANHPCRISWPPYNGLLLVAILDHNDPWWLSGMVAQRQAFDKIPTVSCRGHRCEFRRTDCGRSAVVATTACWVWRMARCIASTSNRDSIEATFPRWPRVNRTPTPLVSRRRDENAGCSHAAVTVRAPETKYRWMLATDKLNHVEPIDFCWSPHIRGPVNQGYAKIGQPMMVNSMRCSI